MRKCYPSNLTDAQWQLIEPLLPSQSAIGHPREVQLRDVVDAIFYVQREGCTWRALPGDFPPWPTVYGYLRLWQQWGLWQQIHDALRTKLREKAGKKPQASAAILDSQSVKTTEKRGRSTALMSPKKPKVASDLQSVDTLGLVLSLVVLEASCPERLGGAAVLMEAAESVKTNLVRLWVDQGFSGPNFARVVKQLAKAEVEVICRQSKDFH